MINVEGTCSASWPFAPSFFDFGNVAARSDRELLYRTAESQLRALGLAF